MNWMSILMRIKSVDAHTLLMAHSIRGFERVQMPSADQGIPSLVRMHLLFE